MSMDRMDSNKSQQSIQYRLSLWDIPHPAAFVSSTGAQPQVIKSSSGFRVPWIKVDGRFAKGTLGMPYVSPSVLPKLFDRSSQKTREMKATVLALERFKSMSSISSCVSCPRSPFHGFKKPCALQWWIFKCVIHSNGSPSWWQSSTYGSAVDNSRHCGPLCELRACLQVQDVWQEDHAQVMVQAHDVDPNDHNR